MKMNKRLNPLFTLKMKMKYKKIITNKGCHKRKGRVSLIYIYLVNYVLTRSPP